MNFEDDFTIYIFVSCVHYYLTENLAKREFCHDNAKYLGNKVGQDYAISIMAKVNAITKFPIPVLQTREL